jgi:hypothetical protein
MLEKGVTNNTKMTIYKMVYLPSLLCGSERCTVLTSCDSRFASTEMRYVSNQEETE